MILITRPLAQTANLKMLLEASDIEYEFFPTFEVKKITLTKPFIEFIFLKIIFFLCCTKK